MVLTSSLEIERSVSVDVVAINASAESTYLSC